MAKSNRIIPLFLLFFIMMSIVIGCKSSNTPNEQNTTNKYESTLHKAVNENVPKEFVELTFLYPGDESRRMKDFLEKEFKEKMKTELNLSIDVTFSPWSQYWIKKDMMLAASEQIDLYWDGITNLSKVNSKMQAVKINDLLNKYGSDLKSNIPESNFEAVTINGNIMGVPSANCPNSAPFESVDIRSDILENVGMKEIKTSNDLELFASKVKNKYKDLNIGSFDLLPALTREFSDQPYVFTTDEYLLSVGQNDNKVYSYFESETFKKVAKLNRSWYLKNYYTDDVTLKYNDSDARMKSGNYVWGQSSVAKPLEIIQDVRRNKPDAKLKSFLLAPDKPKYITTPGNEVLFISPTCKSMDRAMMFLNWIYKSKENYLFTVYGVENKDYKLESNRIKLINTDQLFYEWMFRNINYMEFPDTVDDEFIANYKDWDKNANYSNSFGFFFDSSKVKSYEGKLISVAIELLHPISTGFVDYDEYFPAALDALKAAGIDKYVTEFQRQFDIFLKAKKK